MVSVSISTDFRLEMSQNQGWNEWNYNNPVGDVNHFQLQDDFVDQGSEHYYMEGGNNYAFEQDQHFIDGNKAYSG